MPRLELQTSDLRSRVIEKTTPSRIDVSPGVHFEISDPDRLLRISGEKIDVYEGSQIRPDGFFRRHNVPDGSRWILNRNPRSLWELFVKKQIVFVAEPADQVAKDQNVPTYSKA